MYTKMPPRVHRTTPPKQVGVLAPQKNTPLAVKRNIAWVARAPAMCNILESWQTMSPGLAFITIKFFKSSSVP